MTDKKTLTRCSKKTIKELNQEIDYLQIQNIILNRTIDHLQLKNPDIHGTRFDLDENNKIEIGLRGGRWKICFIEKDTGERITKDIEIHFNEAAKHVFDLNNLRNDYFLKSEKEIRNKKIQIVVYLIFA
jgi:hypothetical protein